MPYRDYNGKSREFWALVVSALYKKTGDSSVRSLAATLAMEPSDKVGEQRLRNMIRASRVPPVPGCKRIALALDIPLMELLDTVPIETNEPSEENELSLLKRMAVEAAERGGYLTREEP
jgi:hypothetical protein